MEVGFEAAPADARAAMIKRFDVGRLLSCLGARCGQTSCSSLCNARVERKVPSTCAPPIPSALKRDHLLWFVVFVSGALSYPLLSHPSALGSPALRLSCIRGSCAHA